MSRSISTIWMGYPRKEAAERAAESATRQAKRLPPEHYYRGRSFRAEQGARDLWYVVACPRAE